MQATRAGRLLLCKHPLEDGDENERASGDPLARTDDTTSSSRATRRQQKDDAAQWLVVLLLILPTAIPIAVSIYVVFDLSAGDAIRETARHLGSAVPVVLHVVSAAVCALAEPSSS